MRRLVGAITLFAIAVTTPAPAQQASELSPSVQQYVSVDATAVVLTNVQIIDGTGGPVKTNQTIVIEDGRITGVGDAGSVRAPMDAMVLSSTPPPVVDGCK
jgi:urease alpha subunit